MEWLGLMNFDKAKTLYGWMEEKSNVSTMSEECLDVLQPRPNPNPRKPSTGSKFKGVLPQPNGNWGAQIYIKQQRIWLGTFRSEEEAAMAYDSASVLFRNAESPRNLSCTFDPVDEQQFQTLYCPKTILSMIKDGSYRARFDEFLRVKFGKNKTRVVGTEAINSLHHVGFSCRQLFQKELTPSDVGKLNRLVIPKKYAVKYLPKITEHDKFDGQVNGVDLLIYDQSMKSWCFRYCYWSSSQSYVFTKGWSQFVKEKGLKSNDIVTFYICERDGESRVFSMIGISRDDGENLYGFDGSGGSESRVRVGPFLDGSDADEKIVLESKVTETAVGFKLFGVQIN